jgi:hypothetical protein
MEQKMDQNKTDQFLGLLLAKMDDIKADNAEMMAGLKRMNAKLDAWFGKTEACLEEEKEPAPEEPRLWRSPRMSLLERWTKKRSEPLRTELVNCAWS